MSLIKPQIFTQELAVYPVDKSTHPEEALQLLFDGNSILIEDFYQTGLVILDELKRAFSNLNSHQFKSARQARGSFREIAHRILLEVEDHQLAVRKSPQIPWLKILYPDLAYFAISFPDIQALNSSWQWYIKGIVIPGLPHKIHPYFGVYFPTRFEHIELFKDWLSSWEGNRSAAYDIGCGSGILSFILEQQNFQKVWASDINPNALKSMEESIRKHSYKKIELLEGDLFAKKDETADLIVFNPPWLPEKRQNNPLDAAVYYGKDLFPNFFEQAGKRLKAQGRLVLLFSNLLQFTHAGHPHPIEEELNKNRRFMLDSLLKKKVAQGSGKTKRNTSHRQNEQVELWVLSKLI
jgi:SAM-dependent methyltransferase